MTIDRITVVQVFSTLTRMPEYVIFLGNAENPQYGEIDWARTTSYARTLIHDFTREYPDLARQIKAVEWF